MIRPIMKAPFILQQISKPATRADSRVAQDLKETLEAHSFECVGMAANMIGVLKRIIVVNDDGTTLLMFNPEITAKKNSYEAEEGCLSLSGRRKVTRYKSITVSFEDESFIKQTKTYTGWTAQIIQHEIDHCNGILI